MENLSDKIKKWPYNIYAVVFGELNIKAVSHTWDVDLANTDDMTHRLNGAFSKLDKDDSDILLLRFKDGLSYKNIASKYNISTSAARYRITKAIDRLQHPKNAKHLIFD